MDKAVKFIAAALTLWLSAIGCATSAELYEGESIHRHGQRSAAPFPTTDVPAENLAPTQQSTAIVQSLVAELT